MLLAAEMKGSTATIATPTLAMTLTIVAILDRASVELDTTHAGFADAVAHLGVVTSSTELKDFSTAIRSRACFDTLKSETEMNLVTDLLSAAGVIGYTRTHALGALTGSDNVGKAGKEHVGTRMAGQAVDQVVQRMMTLLGLDVTIRWEKRPFQLNSTPKDVVSGCGFTQQDHA